MFDTMTITKAGGALCGALLVFLLGNGAAESLYHVGTAGHGDEEHAAGYVIEVETGGGEAEEAARGAGLTFAPEASPAGLAEAIARLAAARMDQDTAAPAPLYLRAADAARLAHLFL